MVARRYGVPREGSHGKRIGVGIFPFHFTFFPHKLMNIFSIVDGYSTWRIEQSTMRHVSCRGKGSWQTGPTRTVSFPCHETSPVLSFLFFRSGSRFLQSGPRMVADRRAVLDRELFRVEGDHPAGCHRGKIPDMQHHFSIISPCSLPRRAS